MKLAAKELRKSEPTWQQIEKIKKRDIYIVLDNVLDTYNIGSVFRLADGAGVNCVYICGESETPPNSRIAKASIGTDKWVPWEYFATTEEAILDLRSKVENIKVVAIEQDKKSIDFRKAEYTKPLALVVGHETFGVSKEVLKLCDEIVEIPMYGVNISLNVMVSLGIVLFRAV